MYCFFFQIACTAIAAALHYLFLVVFVLMLTQGIEILICVVHVFTTKFRLKLLLPVAWRKFNNNNVCYLRQHMNFLSLFHICQSLL